MSETAITISLLALVAVIGLWIGHFKIKGVGLRIGGDRCAYGRSVLCVV